MVGKRGIREKIDKGKRGGRGGRWKGGEEGTGQERTGGGEGSICDLSNHQPKSTLMVSVGKEVNKSIRDASCEYI